jgi:hypothetical protein
MRTHLVLKVLVKCLSHLITSFCVERFDTLFCAANKRVNIWKFILLNLGKFNFLVTCRIR